MTLAGMQAMRDPTDLGAQLRETEEQQLEASEARRKEVEDIKWLMARPQGRRIAWRLLAEAGVYRTSFSPNGSTTFLNEGRRQIGLMLIGEINEHCPEQYLLMLKENGT